MKYIWFIIFILLSVQYKQTIYLPIIYSSTHPIGVYLEYPQNASPYINSHNATGIQWDKVEQIRGEYDWSYYDPRYKDLSEGRIIQIKGTPIWARTYPTDPVCVPPRISFYGDFAQFVIAVIERYNPYAILIWNEPDGYGYPEYIGCFDNGTIYGNFIKSIYPIIKLSKPEIILVAGETAGSNNQFTEDFYASVGDNFDASSFHFYTAYGWNNLNVLENWMDYHRNKTDKPVWLTETALKCGKWPEICTSPDFNRSQAEYLEYLINMPNQPDLITWYHLFDDGWAQVGMIDGGIKKDVWYVYNRYNLSP